MQKTTTGGRWLAIVAGTIATGGALAILTQDAIRTGNWTLEHGLLPILVAVSIVAGLLMTHAARARKPFAALGFFIVAAAATWGTLYTSIGKQAEVAGAKEIAAAERVRLRGERTKAQEMLDEERKAKARECRSGRGKRCEGIQASVSTYEHAVAGIDAQVEKLGPETPVNGKAQKMAELVAALTGKDKARLQHVFELVEPVTYSLIFELCAMVAFHFAFGHRAPAKVPAQPAPAVPSEKPKGPTGSGPNKPRRTVRKQVLRTVGQSSGTVVPFTRERARADIKARLGRSETIPSQDTLAGEWNRPKSTVSGWLTAWEADGTIPARVVEGRRKTLGANVTPIRLSA